jgi:hypothetical protein
VRLPRKIKTILTPIILVVIGLFLLVNVLGIPIYTNQATRINTNILDIQKIVGIAQIILGIATALIALPTASSFLF